MGNVRSFKNESIDLIPVKINVQITLHVFTIVNLAFMNGINCMGTVPGYNRAKRMLKQLKIIKK